MKRVITKSTEKTVLVTDMDHKKFYGFLKGEKVKGVITRAEFEIGNFLMLVMDDFTNGNGYSFPNLPMNTLENVARCCERHGFILYEFETHEDLFRWLME